ncbi:MAG: mechanosensitive ion channel family protein [bacterium]|nr:mechanosensitive ion channel family protein [bacterium]
MITHEIEQYAILTLYTLGGFIVGYLLEKTILSRIEKYAQKTKWKFDDVLFLAIRGLAPVWMMLLAFSIAVNNSELNEQFRQLSNKISMSLLVLSLSVLVTRLLVKLIEAQTNDHSGNSPSHSIILNIIRVVIFLIGAMLILQVFGVSIAPLLTALGVGGLAVALALQETLSNLFAGLQIIASKKIRTGDYIRLNTGEEGYILDITWRNTVIKAMQNNLIIIPNSKLSTAIITNFNFPEMELGISVEVGVSYECDLSFVEKITLQTAKETMQTVNGGVKDFEPTIRYKSFSDSSITLGITLRAAEFEQQFFVKHEFIKALHTKYKENGIVIPYPVTTVMMKQ